MLLTGQQKEILKEGILEAYSTEDELKILLSEKMNLRYSAIAKGEDYISRVAFLVEKLEADGEVEQLIRVVVEKKPHSPYLTQVKTEFANVNNAKIAPQPLTPTGTLSNLPSPRTSFFVGRDETFKRVHEQLQESSQLAICAVSSMGAILLLLPIFIKRNESCTPKYTG